MATSPTRSRGALLAWGLATVAGTVGVFWLRSYLEGLATLAQTDRDAALALFRSRALPALLGVVAIAVAAGAMLMRQGLQMVNAPREARRAENDDEDERRQQSSARTMGWMMACAGFTLATVPLVLISIVFWLLR